MHRSAKTLREDVMPVGGCCIGVPVPSTSVVWRFSAWMQVGCVWEWARARMRVYVYACVCVYVCMVGCVHVCVNVWMCVCVCVCVCVDFACIHIPWYDTCCGVSDGCMRTHMLVFAASAFMLHTCTPLTIVLMSNDYAVTNSRIFSMVKNCGTMPTRYTHQKHTHENHACANPHTCTDDW